MATNKFDCAKPFMTKSRFIGVALAMAVTSIAGTSIAQEASESHIKAAKQVIATTKATARLNEILPRSSAALISRLIQSRPDLEPQITEVVNETAIELAVRRGDLEVEAGKIYARIFDEAELDDINAFFATETGQKFLNELPILVREVDRASRVWTTGINRDLSLKVAEKLKAAGIE